MVYSNETTVNMYKSKLKFPELEFIWVTAAGIQVSWDL